jgi:hypothetical protein
MTWTIMSYADVSNPYEANYHVPGGFYQPIAGDSSMTISSY